MTDERSVVREQPERRPYCARVEIQLDPSDTFKFDGDVSLLLPVPQVIRVEAKADDHSGKVTQTLRTSIEGFASASEAEQAGLRLAMAVLWVGISAGIPFRLRYHTPLPAVVYDRTVPSGAQVSGHGRILRASSVEKFYSLVNEALFADFPAEPTLLLSMELFAGARLEETPRSRFVGLVSALEPLAEQQDQGETVNQFLSKVIESLPGSGEIPDRIRQSLEGRLHQLKRESVRQAIHRLVREVLPDDSGATLIIDEAYSIRSALLHTGKAEVDLDEKARKVESVMGRLYGSLLGLQPLTS